MVTVLAFIAVYLGLARPGGSAAEAAVASVGHELRLSSGSGSDGLNLGPESAPAPGSVS